jgi:uncharacterized membrane protein YecN with MAPEG domain
MKLLAPVTALTAIILVPLLLRLAFGVIRKRREHRIAVGTGNQADLEAAIRAHGNFIEYVPFVLLLLLCAEVNGAPLWLTVPAGTALVAGRLIHAGAIPAGDIAKRVRGMKLTFASIALGAVANIAPFVALLIA